MLDILTAALVTQAATVSLASQLFALLSLKVVDEIFQASQTK